MNVPGTIWDKLILKERPSVVTRNPTLTGLLSLLWESFLGLRPRNEDAPPRSPWEAAVDAMGVLPVVPRAHPGFPAALLDSSAPHHSCSPCLSAPQGGLWNSGSLLSLSRLAWECRGWHYALKGQPSPRRNAGEGRGSTMGSVEAGEGPSRTQPRLPRVVGQSFTHALFLSGLTSLPHLPPLPGINY